MLEQEEEGRERERERESINDKNNHNGFAKGAFLSIFTYVLKAPRPNQSRTRGK